MTKVLLYNIDDAEKRTAIRLSTLRLGLECVEVPQDACGHPLGYLLGREGFAPSSLPPEPFEAEMLVMERLSTELLDALRAHGAAVALKAVVTEQNLSWSSAKLCAELGKEHEALRRLAGKKAENRHVHKKRKK